MTTERTVLLTGVTGFLGRELMAQLLTDDDARITCLVRAADDAEAAQRLRGTVDDVFGAGAWRTVWHRVNAVRGDVTRPSLGLSRSDRARLVRTTTHLVHGAASVRFDLPLSQARRINVAGAVEAAAFASAAHHRGTLQRFEYISTSFVAGRHPVPFGEDELDVGQRFRNTYEQSKFEAELVIRAVMPRVPTTVVRPSIVIGDSRSGATSAFNVVYWPLRVYADGVLRVAPAPPDLPVDMVPVDFVARGALAALFNGEDGATYALAAGDRAVDAQTIAAMAARAFNVPPPRFLRTRVERALVPLLGPVSRVGPWRRFGRSFRQFLPYFESGSRFETHHADALLHPQGIDPPVATSVLEPVLEFARVTDFGRNQAATRRLRHRLSRERRRGLAESRSRTRVSSAGCE